MCWTPDWVKRKYSDTGADEERMAARAVGKVICTSAKRHTLSIDMVIVLNTPLFHGAQEIATGMGNQEEELPWLMKVFVLA